MNNKQYRELLELTLSLLSGRSGEVAIVGKDKFSFTFPGSDPGAVDRICQHFRQDNVKCLSEQVEGYTIVYIDLPE